MNVVTLHLYIPLKNLLCQDNKSEIMFFLHCLILFRHLLFLWFHHRNFCDSLHIHSKKTCTNKHLFVYVISFKTFFQQKSSTVITITFLCNLRPFYREMSNKFYKQTSKEFHYQTKFENFLLTFYCLLAHYFCHLKSVAIFSTDCCLLSNWHDLSRH